MSDLPTPPPTPPPSPCTHGRQRETTYNSNTFYRCSHCSELLTKVVAPNDELINAIIGDMPVTAGSSPSNSAWMARRDILAKHFTVTTYVPTASLAAKESGNG